MAVETDCFSILQFKFQAQGNGYAIYAPVSYDGQAKSRYVGTPYYWSRQYDIPVLGMMADSNIDQNDIPNDDGPLPSFDTTIIDAYGEDAFESFT